MHHSCCSKVAAHNDVYVYQHAHKPTIQLKSNIYSGYITQNEKLLPGTTLFDGKKPVVCVLV